jgi:hypothetical protein
VPGFGTLRWFSSPRVLASICIGRRDANPSSVRPQNSPRPHFLPPDNSRRNRYRHCDRCSRYDHPFRHRQRLGLNERQSLSMGNITPQKLGFQPVTTQIRFACPVLWVRNSSCSANRSNERSTTGEEMVLMRKPPAAGESARPHPFATSGRTKASQGVMDSRKRFQRGARDPF